MLDDAFARPVAQSPLEKSFGCSDGTEPCAVFVDWKTHFAAPDGGD